MPFPVIVLFPDLPASLFCVWSLPAGHPAAAAVDMAWAWPGQVASLTPEQSDGDGSAFAAGFSVGASKHLVTHPWGALWPAAPHKERCCRPETERTGWS